MRYGIVVEILSVPTEDWNKSPVPLPAVIAQVLIKIKNTQQSDIKIITWMISAVKT